jgi:hypothetical protein
MTKYLIRESGVLMVYEFESEYEAKLYCKNSESDYIQEVKPKA